jgi:uncharacterized protein (DUF2267 family)
MSLHFYAYARKGYEFIDEVARELKSSDVDKVGRMFRCVLRAMRNKLGPEASFGLLAQLPMAIKGIYVDGWKNPAKNNASAESSKDIVSEVIKEDDQSAWRDFSDESEVKDAIIAVYKVLSRHIVITEYANILSLLPSDFHYLLEVEADMKP